MPQSQLERLSFEVVSVEAKFRQEASNLRFLMAADGHRGEH